MSISPAQMAACYVASHSGSDGDRDDDDDDEEEESSRDDDCDDGYWEEYEVYDDDDEYNDDCDDGDNTNENREKIEAEINNEWYQFLMEIVQAVGADIKAMEETGHKLYEMFWDSTFSYLTIIYISKDGLPIKKILEFDPDLDESNTSYYNPYKRTT